MAFSAMRADRSRGPQKRISGTYTPYPSAGPAYRALGSQEPAVDRLVAVRPHRDQANGEVQLLLDVAHVVLGRLRKGVDGPAASDVARIPRSR